MARLLKTTNQAKSHETAAMSVLAIVQARTSSSRLPGKVLLPIGTKPMVLYQLDRLQNCSRIDTVVLATSDQSSDDPLAV